MEALLLLIIAFFIGEGNTEVLLISTIVLIMLILIYFRIMLKAGYICYNCKYNCGNKCAIHYHNVVPFDKCKYFERR